MNDQEHVTDLIFTEKKMSANYDTYASECVNTCRVYTSDADDEMQCGTIFCACSIRAT